LINKENIKTNKINTKLLQFFGNKKQDEIKKDENSIDNNINNNEKNENIKENYENGLEVEITSEENEELVKLFESQFLKSV
jgi:hypothetical protein